MNTVIVETIKGVDAYAVVVNGAEVATAHRVHVNGSYSVKVGGQWRGVLPEAKAVAYLRGTDFSAPMDRSATRALLGA